METTLWNYIDGTMDPAERAQVEQLLQTEPLWQTSYAALLEVHRLMQDSTALEQPSLRFTRNVMEEIARLHIVPAAKKYINPYIIRGIGAFFLVTIASLLIFALAQIDWHQPASTVSFIFNPSRLNWAHLFSNTYINLLMMANIVLALMLLDMYLTRRKKSKLNAEK